MNQELARELTQCVVEFCRFARTRGLPGGLHHTFAAVQAVKSVWPRDREAIALALRAALCSCKAEWDLFDELLKTFQAQGQHASKSPTPLAKQARRNTPARETRPQYLIGQISADVKAEDEGKAVGGASARERLAKLDFSEVPQHDLALLEELSFRLFRQMSLRLSRRFKPGYRPGPADLRRTIRKNLGHGGDPILLAYRNRKPQKSRLTILLDVSGSMNAYSMFFVKFAYALQKPFQQVDTLIFSTSVVEITNAMRLRRLSEALRNLSQLAAGWSAGTKIGDSLRELNRLLATRLRPSDTTFLILSDGWDTGDPAVLAAELKLLRRRVRKLIWLNPLLGLANYQPVTRGMSAAMPYLDVFAPAHNLESLLALERHL